MYKTIVITYLSKANTMAKLVEDKTNEMHKEGYELVTFSISLSTKTIIVFKTKG